MLLDSPDAIPIPGYVIKFKRDPKNPDYIMVAYKMKIDDPKEAPVLVRIHVSTLHTEWVEDTDGSILQSLDDIGVVLPIQ